MRLVHEYLNETHFERGKDPKKSMDIGMFYDIWRKDHLNKPILKINYLLTDPYENKKTYSVQVIYTQKYGDTLEFGNEILRGNWMGAGPVFALANMQNKPYRYFGEETTFWEDHLKHQFNKEIIDNCNKEHVNELLVYLSREFLDEDDFDEQMRKWFATGVMTVHELKVQVF